MNQRREYAVHGCVCQSWQWTTTNWNELAQHKAPKQRPRGLLSSRGMRIWHGIKLCWRQ